MIFAAIFSIAFLVVSIKRPAWAYGLILALLPIYIFRFPVLNIPTTALELLVGVFLFGTLIANFNKATLELFAKQKRVNIWVGFFILAGILATIYSPEPARALGQLKAFIIEPILMFYASLIVFKTKADLNTGLKFLFWSASLISIFGLVQYVTHILLPLRFWGNGEEIKRITSVFEYPNAFALYLAPLLLFFLTLFARGYDLGKKYWVFIGLTAMSFAVVLTYSRGAWLGIIAGLVVLSLRQTGVSLKHWRAITIVCLLVLSPILFSRFKSTFNDGSSSERIELYKAAVNKIMQEPLLGNGLYGFRTTLESSTYTGEILNYPHNIILNFWVELGILGVISFSLLVLFSIREYWIHPTTLKFAAGLFLLVLVTHGMVDAPYFKNDLSILFWFILSLFYINE